jgi:DNA (cytosine-5)-methyltransferase 1
MAGGAAQTIHPFQHRLLSILECSHLQTFPRDFKWGDALDRWGAMHVRAMIGEAVPPRFTKHHGTVLKRLLTQYRASETILVDDQRISKARRTLDRQQRRRGQLELRAGP